MPQQNLLSTLHFRRQAQFQRDYEARVRFSEMAEDRDAIHSSSMRFNTWAGRDDLSQSWAAQAALTSSLDSPRASFLAPADQPSAYAQLMDNDDDAATDVVMDVDG